MVDVNVNHESRNRVHYYSILESYESQGSCSLDGNVVK